MSDTVGSLLDQLGFLRDDHDEAVRLALRELLIRRATPSPATPKESERVFVKELHRVAELVADAHGQVEDAYNDLNDPERGRPYANGSIKMADRKLALADEILTRVLPSVPSVAVPNIIQQAAAIARTHPFADGTHAGTKQAWLRESIAAKIEALSPAPHPVTCARCEEQQAVIEEFVEAYNNRDVLEPGEQHFKSGAWQRWIDAIHGVRALSEPKEGK